MISSVFAAEAQSPIASSLDFQKFAMKLRENALLQVAPQVVTPSSPGAGFNRYPWKRNIMTTVFWVGERPTVNNPVPNYKSSWDPQWARNYGGYDDPDPSRRRNFLPANFVPRQNPFYVALPYNDVTRGTTKPESRKVIPWFKQAFERPARRSAKAAGSPSATATASATRSGRIAARSARTTLSTFSATTVRARISTRAPVSIFPLPCATTSAWATRM